MSAVVVPFLGRINQAEQPKKQTRFEAIIEHLRVRSTHDGLDQGELQTLVKQLTLINSGKDDREAVEEETAS